MVNAQLQKAQYAPRELQLESLPRLHVSSCAADLLAQL